MPRRRPALHLYLIICNIYIRFGMFLPWMVITTVKTPFSVMEEMEEIQKLNHMKSHLPWGMTLNCQYSGMEVVNIISNCIVRLLYSLGVSSHFFSISSQKKGFLLGKNLFLFMGREEIPFFWEEAQP